MEKTYQSVFDLAGKLKEWSVISMLDGLSPEKRTLKMEEVFLRAVGHCDDESALAYYSLLWKNFEDVAVNAATEGKDDSDFFTRDEAEAIVAKARQASTLKTVDLYCRIAGIKKLKSGKYIRDDKFVASEEARLLMTKKAMLGYIASRWYKSPDIEESEVCLKFLFTAYEFSSHYKEDRMIEDLMRDVTPDYFPIKRLARGIGLLSENEKYDSIRHKVKKFREILGNAWLKNSDTLLVGNVFNTMWPILETIPDHCHSGAGIAFTLLKKSAVEITRFVTAAEELCEMMRSSGSGKERVPGDIGWSSEKVGRVDVVIEARADFSPLYGKEYDSSEAHRWFELARDYIIKWREQHICYSVSLILVVKQGNRDKQLFSRSQTFGKK